MHLFIRHELVVTLIWCGRPHETDPFHSYAFT